MGWRRLVPVLTLLFLLIPAAAFSQQENLACNPQETADVCELKIQRNSGFDQVAIEKRKQQIMQQAEKANELYWNEWVTGDIAKASWWSNIWDWLSRKKLASK